MKGLVAGTREEENSFDFLYCLFKYSAWLNLPFFSLSLEIWDIGGQPRFRSMWERYCRGVNAIV